MTEERDVPLITALGAKIERLSTEIERLRRSNERLRALILQLAPERLDALEPKP